MSQDTLLKDTHGNVYSMDNLATQKWLEGHYSGLDQCCEWLEQRATVLFNERRLDQAVTLQKLADEMKSDLEPQMIARAQEHEKEYPSQLKRAKS